MLPDVKGSLTVIFWGYYATVLQLLRTFKFTENDAPLIACCQISTNMQKRLLAFFYGAKESSSLLLAAQCQLHDSSLQKFAECKDASVDCGYNLKLKMLNTASETMQYDRNVKLTI